MPLRPGRLALLAALCAASCYPQLPPLDKQSIPALLIESQEWMDAGSYHVARQKLTEVLQRSSFATREKDVLFWLVQSAFKDQEYEEAYQWATEFLQEYPNDNRRVTVLYVQGVSAYQSGRLNEAVSALGSYLQKAEDDPQRGSGCFWHAMAELDRGDTASAQDDIRRCYDDPSARAYRDYILLGWALSLERRGDLEGTAERLEKLLADFPRSDLATDARLRLASISLRQGRLARTLNMLEQASPSYPSQKQEYLLLEAETSVRLGRYQAARDAYAEFADRFGDSPHARKASYGLGWADVKLGDLPGAQRVFDSLGRGHDSIAFASLYQSGIISILRGRIDAALITLDTLTSLSPYDRDAVNAYFQMGMIEYRSKHYREARRDFQLAARLFPDADLRTAAYHMLGESNMAMGDFSNAQYAFSQVRKVHAPPEILAPSLFQEGVALYHLGRFRSCGEVFDQYLGKFPRDDRAAEGCLWRAEAYYQDYKFADAERLYSEALRRFGEDPKKAEAAYGYAWALFEEKKFSQAASAFDRFTKSYPNDGHYLDAMLRKADSYFATGEYDKSAALYESLGAERGSGRQVEYAAFQLAMSYVQRGEADRGVEQLRNFLTRFPSSIYAEVVQFNIGWTYFSKEQYALAVPELQTVVHKYGDSQLLPRVLFNLGDSYYNLKQYDSARVYYQRVIKEYPSSLLVADALSGLQYTYAAQGKPEGALAEIEKVMSERPAGAPEDELILKKGDILFAQGDFAGAITQYQRVMTLNPSQSAKAKALYQLGRAYEQEENPLKAASIYGQILSEAPDSEIVPQAALALGLAQIKARHYTQAVDALKGFDGRYPASPLGTEARYQLGVAYSNVPDKMAALAQFQQVIALHPGDVFADRSRLRTAEIDRDRKRNAAAIDTLSGIVSRRSDDIAGEALLMIGENYLLMKRTKDAMQAYADVIRQYTDFPLVVEKAKLGEGACYERLRDRQRARASYESIASSAVDPAVRKEAQDRLRKLR